jgi:hypothetical protein
MGAEASTHDDEAVWGSCACCHDRVFTATLFVKYSYLAALRIATALAKSLIKFWKNTNDPQATRASQGQDRLLRTMVRSTQEPGSDALQKCKEVVMPCFDSHLYTHVPTQKQHSHEPAHIISIRARDVGNNCTTRHIRIRARDDRNNIK